MLTIRWKVKAGDRTYAVRNSTHPLYVSYARPIGTPYLSLVDLTARAADRHRRQSATSSRTSGPSSKRERSVPGRSTRCPGE